MSDTLLWIRIVAEVIAILQNSKNKEVTEIAEEVVEVLPKKAKKKIAKVVAKVEEKDLNALEVIFKFIGGLFKGKK